MVNTRYSEIPPLEREREEGIDAYYRRLDEHLRAYGAGEVDIKAARGMAAALSPGCREMFFSFSGELMDKQNMRIG